MKMLVTGGTGFTGTALVRRLLSDGHSVVVLDYKEGLAASELKRRGAEVILGSVTDRDVVTRAMRGVDFVHHLAAAFRELNVPERHYYEVNVEGTRNVLTAAARAGVQKVVYCSTCGVHGNIDHPPAAEDSPIKPADYYQQTKYEAEPFVREWNRRGLRTTILRPAAIYGPGDPERFFMIFRRVARGVFPMFGDGKTPYHPLYIDNLVDAFIAAMPLDVGNGEAYLIADENYVEIEKLVKAVAAALGVDVSIPHYPLLPSGRCRPRLRDALQAIRRDAADLPAPRRLVSAEPCIRHPQGEAGLGLPTARRTDRRPCAHGELVSQRGVSAVAGHRSRRARA